MRMMVGLVACSMMAGCSSRTAGMVSAMQGKPAPAFELNDLEGAAVRLADLRGRPVVLAFFAYG